MSLLQKLRPLVLAAGLAGLTGGCTEKSTPQETITVDYETDDGTLSQYSIPSSALEDIPGFTKETVAQYHPRFKRDRHISGIKILFMSGVTPEIANGYDPRFSIEDMRTLHYFQISSEIANTFESRFDVDDIIKLRRSQTMTPPTIANLYDRRFGAIDIINLQALKITPELANAYNPAFFFSEVKDLFDNRIDVAVANTYARYGIKNSQEVIACAAAGITTDDLDKYLSLNAKYGTRINGYDIAQFVRSAVPFAVIEKAAQEHMLREAMK